MYEFSEFKILNHLDRVKAISRGELIPPVMVEIDLTDACNHRCLWCLDHSSNSKVNTSLKESFLFEIADQMTEQGVRAVIFKGGGEPLIYYSFGKVVQHLSGRGLQLGLVTNGETINRHLEAIPYLSWVNVSLDAASNQTHQKLHKPFKTDAFHTIVDNLYQISTSVFTGVLYLVHPENIGEMVQAANLAREVGCRSIAFRQLTGEEAERVSQAMLREIDENLGKIKDEYEGPDFQVLGTRPHCFYCTTLPYQLCLAHHLIGILASDGHLYPCRTLKGDMDYSYGSVYRDTFQELWYGEKRKAVLKKISQHACNHRCVGRTCYDRYDHYNQLLEYITAPKEKVGHVDFL